MSHPFPFKKIKINKNNNNVSVLGFQMKTKAKLKKRFLVSDCVLEVQPFWFEYLSATSGNISLWIVPLRWFRVVVLLWRWNYR